MIGITIIVKSDKFCYFNKFACVNWADISKSNHELIFVDFTSKK